MSRVIARFERRPDRFEVRVGDDTVESYVFKFAALWNAIAWRMNGYSPVVVVELDRVDAARVGTTPEHTDGSTT